MYTASDNLHYRIRFRYVPHQLCLIPWSSSSALLGQGLEEQEAGHKFRKEISKF